MDQEHQITLFLPRARLSPVISTMPEGLEGVSQVWILCEMNRLISWRFNK